MWKTWTIKPMNKRLHKPYYIPNQVILNRGYLIERKYFILFLNDAPNKKIVGFLFPRKNLNQIRINGELNGNCYVFFIYQIIVFYLYKIYNYISNYK